MSNILKFTQLLSEIMSNCDMFTFLTLLIGTATAIHNVLTNVLFTSLIYKQIYYKFTINLYLFTYILTS